MVLLKLTTVGEAVGVVLPKAMLDRLKLAKGDAVYAIEQPDGSYRLSPTPTDGEEKAAHARDIMDRYPNTLAALAK